MNLIENIRLAAEGLKSNKMRAILTMLGIIIGIAAVIGIMTIGSGISGAMNRSLSSMGASNVDVYLQTKIDPNADSTTVYNDSAPKKMEEKNLISDTMIAQMRERYPKSITGVSITEGGDSAKVEMKHRYANAYFNGVNEDQAKVANIKMLRGRTVETHDIKSQRFVAVVSDKFAENLFGKDISKALGQEFPVTLKNEMYLFSIIGVYKYQMMGFGGGTMAADRDMSTQVYIPVSTMKRITKENPGYQNITITVAPGVNSTDFSQQVSDFLNRYYRTNKEYQISASSMEKAMEQMNQMMSTMSMGLSAIAAISLLVGGIGVMNIMLVSVTERTREIGTRKALGATNGNIRVQFVVESMIVCLIGGVIGIILGAVLGYFGSKAMGAPGFPTLDSILVSVGFSLAIGVFFGYYPANKAAKLDPIEALRYE